MAELLSNVHVYLRICEQASLTTGCCFHHWSGKQCMFVGFYADAVAGDKQGCMNDETEKE